jgi:murein tripeptide amidase MpaA
MNRIERALGAALLALGLAGSAAAQDFAKYRNFAEMSSWVKGFVGANKALARLESIGQTVEGRDLWAIEIGNPAGVPTGERPALLIAANLEGDHLFGSELALFTADYLVKNAAKPEVRALLDAGVVYILPRLNPDAAEFMWAPAQWARRTNASSRDDDNDARTDEDGPDDLNEDGVITVMRVPDPNGAYIIDPDEKRAMRRADPKKGERGAFSIYWEGLDNDGDGFVNEDPPGGVNINRNFMHEYPYYKPESGRYMVSEAETRAVLAWIVKHRNIAAILTFGESDNLIAAPNASGQLAAARTIDLTAFADASIAGAGKTGMVAGGLAALFGRGGRGGGGEMMISEEMIQMLMASGGGFEVLMGGRGGGPGGQRGGQPTAAQPTGRAAMPARAAATAFNAADLDYFRAISQKYAQMTGIRTAPPLVKPEGAFFQYGYFQFGVPSFSTPGWGLPDAPRSGGQPSMAGGPGGQPAGGAAGGGEHALDASQVQQMMVQMGQRGGPGQRGGTGIAEPPGGVDKQVLQWLDKEKIDGFVAWTKTQHPDFGEVEIGGFKPYVLTNPPAARIAELGKGHAEFAIYLTTLFPRIKVAKLEAVNHGGGLFRIKAEVSNEGFLPTALAHAVVARAVKPTMVQLQVAPETILSGQSKTTFIQALNGSGDRQKFEWLIKAKAGETIALKVVSQKGGADSASVVLK